MTAQRTRRVCHCTPERGIVWPCPPRNGGATGTTLLQQKTNCADGGANHTETHRWERVAVKASVFCCLFYVRKASFSSSFQKSTLVQLYGARCGSRNYILCLGAHTAKRPHLNLMSLCVIGPEDEEGEQERTDRYSIYGERESAGLVSESALPRWCALLPHHQDLRWFSLIYG